MKLQIATITPVATIVVIANSNMFFTRVFPLNMVCDFAIFIVNGTTISGASGLKSVPAIMLYLMILHHGVIY